MKAEPISNSIEFYRCSVCGNLMIKLVDSGLTPQCCGRDMEILKAGETDGTWEKHIPVWRMDGCKLMVQVGEDLHPMSESHMIVCIVVKTNTGIHIRMFKATDEPEACFKLCKEEEVESIYEFCNVHSLWKAGVEESI